jgi:ABC-type dipeptide/oligopeptide/nickel transport system permease component
VVEELARTFPATLELAAGGAVFAVALGIPIGVLSATRPYSLADRLSMVVALLGVSMPVFWTAILLIMTFSIHFRWLPTSGRGGFESLILPAITVGSVSLALLARMTRSAMLDVLQEDYVRTASAKGLSQRVVVYRHALRNALIPVVTVLGQQFGLLLGGAVITETVFAWPGMGRLIVQAILARDARVVQGAVLILAFTIVLINVLVDIAYGYIDPRIRYQ